jgi:hypothetical protein
MTDRPTIRWIRNGKRSGLITFAPIAGYDLTIEREYSGVTGPGFVVRAHKVNSTEPPLTIARRPLMRDARAAAVEWVERERRLVRNVSLAWNLAIVEAADRDAAGGPDLPRVEDVAAERFGRPEEVAREGAELDASVIPMPFADAAAVSAALDGSSKVVVLVPDDVNRTLLEIAERNGIPYAEVREMYQREILGQNGIDPDGPADQDVDAGLRELARREGLPDDSIRQLYRGILRAFSGEGDDPSASQDFRIPRV